MNTKVTLVVSDKLRAL